MKTARFAQLVDQGGRPTVYLSWAPPEKDPVLKKAVKENRVLTLHQELHGGKKDYGTVGYFKDRHAQLLVFPKSLRRFTDQKIIAIDYAVLSDGKMLAGEVPTAPPRSKPSAKAAEEPPPPPAVSAPSSAKETAARKPARASAHLKPITPAPAAAAIKDRDPLKSVLAEVRRARDDLAAGRAVPAFQRLDRLLAHSPS